MDVVFRFPETLSSSVFSRESLGAAAPVEFHSYFSSFPQPVMCVWFTVEKCRVYVQFSVFLLEPVLSESMLLMFQKGL